MTPFDQLPQDAPELPEDPQELVAIFDDAPIEERYWAAKQAKDVVSAMQRQESEFFDALERRGVMGIWRMQWAQYYSQNPQGEGGSSHMISACGENGELLQFRLQQVRPLITRQIQMVLGPRAAFQCIGVNDDYQTRAQVNICDSAVEFTYRESHSERKEYEIAESDSNFGSGHGWCRWDEEKGEEMEVTEQVPIPDDPFGATAPVKAKKRSGMPTVTVLYPWECIQSLTAKEHLWRCVRERVSRWELIARYPEMAQRIRAIKGLDRYTTEELFGYDNNLDADNDDVIVHHFYHARCASMPDGRYLGYVGDVVLWDLPCPVSKGMPIQEMCAERFIGSSLGYASGWDLCAPNQMIDQITSDMASNLATFGRVVIGMPQGSDYDVDALANGMRVIMLPPSGEEPKPLQFAGIPEAAKWSLEFLIRQMNGISGINSIAQGNPEVAVPSGSMAALFHEIAYEFQGARQAALDAYRQGMAELQLDMVRQRASAPFLIQVAGLSERPYMQQFEKSAFEGVKRVLVKTANPMMRSVAGRMDIYTAVKEIPNPADRAAAIELITTGNSKDFAKVERSEDMAIVWENEQLAQGILVKVDDSDDPFLHWRKHKAEFNARREWLLSPEGSPALVAFKTHMKDHEIVYAQVMSLETCMFLNIQPSPTRQMMMQAMMAPPANTNQAQLPPEGSMAGGEGADPAQAAQQMGAGAPPGGPAEAAGVQQPKQPEPAQPPQGGAQQGEAA